MKIFVNAMAAILLLIHATPVLAMDRNASLINSFQVFCALETPDFDRINSKATAMKLPVHKDLSTPVKEGMFAHSKSWFVSLNTGPHELIASEAVGPKGHVTICGISANDTTGIGFEKELITALKLGHPSLEKDTTDSKMHAMEWKEVYGTDSTLQLFIARSQPSPGFLLNYMVMVPPASH